VYNAIERSAGCALAAAAAAARGFLQEDFGAAPAGSHTVELAADSEHTPPPRVQTRSRCSAGCALARLRPRQTFSHEDFGVAHLRGLLAALLILALSVSWY